MPFFLPALVAAQQAPAQSPRTFAQALDDVPWDPAEKGVLLAVSAERTRPGRGQAIPLPTPHSYNLKELASAFDRMPLKVGRLTVLVPTTMRVLVPALLSPEEAAWQNPDEALRALLASFTKAQWQAVTSERGLGLSDLTVKQQGMYLASLPSPFQVRLQPAQTIERTPEGIRISSDPVRPQPPQTLTPEQRSQVRLRLNHSVRFSYKAEGSDSSGGQFGFGNLIPKRKEAEYVFADAFPHNTYKHPTIQDQANRPKPSDLDTTPLTQPISLTGAKTVGDLVWRAAQATNLEIYADPRVTALSVLLWGDNASAGDILAALSRAVTGTFRKVGPAYVLTHDRLGLAALYEPQALWLAKLNLLLQEQREAQTKAIKNAMPQDLLTFAPGDPLTLPRELLRDPSEGVAVSALPPSVQTLVREQLTQVHEDIAAGRSSIISSGKPITQLRSDKVWPNRELKFTYLVPGIGAVRSNQIGLWDLISSFFYASPSPTVSPMPTPSVVWPKTLERIAVVTAQTPEEAKVLAQAAKQGGLTGLWLQVPLSAAKAKPLLEAARAEGLAVGLAVAPFEVSNDPLPTGATLDLSATLVTSDLYRALWATLLLPEQALFYPPHTQLVRYDDAVLLALQELAALPHLSALYFAELIPPGYQKPRRLEDPGSFTLRPGDFGYTLDNRLAFLRQTGCDPVDTYQPSAFSSETSLPFFAPFGMMNQPTITRLPDGTIQRLPPPADVTKQWKEFRAAQVTAFLPKLRQRLQQAAPQLPVYVPGQSPDFIWTGSWDKPEQLPTLKVDPQLNDVSNAVVLPQVRQRSTRVFNQSFSSPKMTLDQLRRDINENLKSYPGWDGFLISLAGIPLEQAKALLRGLGEGKELP